MGDCLSAPLVTTEETPPARPIKGQGGNKKPNAGPAAKPAAGSAPRPAAKASKSKIHESITVAENPIGRDIFDYYEKVEHLAQGSTCDVWTARSKKTGQMYALKIIPKSTNDPQNATYVEEMRNEIDILKKIDHPNVFRVYEMFESDHFIYMVSEYLSNGDLYSRPLPYSEPDAAMVLTKMLSAVTYLHEHHVIHRDLKMENVMYDDQGEPKLIDFGLSKPNVGMSENMKCRVGTLATMSPQVLKGKYTNKADVYAIGVIAYNLLSGKRPFDGSSKREIAQKIIKGEFSMDGDPDWENVSQPAKDFCKSLLSYDPADRPTASTALNHPWLRKTAQLATPQPTSEDIARVQNALARSSQSSKLKKIAAMMIAYKSSNKSIKELRDAFNAIDVNNHGAINLWEFRQALKGSGYSDDKLKEIFQDIDVNDTGMINYTEFLAITLESRGGIEESKIKEAFDRIDTEQTGYLSREELCSIMGQACSTENCDKLVDSILEELDTNMDGKS